MDNDVLTRLEPLLRAIVERTEREADEPTYRCLACLDSGYIIAYPEKVVSQLTGKPTPADGASVARFCSCDTGITRESGLWASKLSPAKGQRSANDEMRALYFRRLRAHSRGNDLRAKVDRLMNDDAKREEGDR